MESEDESFEQNETYITYKQSLDYNNGDVSYIEYISDELLNFFLKVENLNDIDESHPKIKDLPDPSDDLQHLKRCLYQIRLLMNGEKLEPFIVTYNREEDYPSFPDIYDGWHRIRAYQYMKYEKIPCYISKEY